MLVMFLGGCATVPKQAPLSMYAPPSISGAGIYHTVEKGQTLYRIAKTYDMDVSELMRVNHIYNPSQLEVGQTLFIPKGVVPAVLPKLYKTPDLEKARAIVGPKKFSYRWETITVHHSATLKGSAKLFDRDHRRRKMGGLFYHFVIGNGSNTSDGAIEAGWRWKKQVKANRPYDIQICLVGDFSKQQVSQAQFDALSNLIGVLQGQYNISVNNIRKHDDIKGKHTECPGRNFPFNKLISKLSEQKGRYIF